MQHFMLLAGTAGRTRPRCPSWGYYPRRGGSARRDAAGSALPQLPSTLPIVHEDTRGLDARRGAASHAVEELLAEMQLAAPSLCYRRRCRTCMRCSHVRRPHSSCVRLHDCDEAAARWMGCSRAWKGLKLYTGDRCIALLVGEATEATRCMLLYCSPLRCSPFCCPRDGVAACQVRWSGATAPLLPTSTCSLKLLFVAP
ncbi:hypothetical protein Dimus_005303 [Dionaea muscipula]